MYISVKGRCQGVLRRSGRSIVRYIRPFSKSSSSGVRIAEEGQFLHPRPEMQFSGNDVGEVARSADEQAPNKLCAGTGASSRYRDRGVNGKTAEFVCCMTWLLGS